MLKEAPSSRLPGALAAYVGYLNGGIGTNVVFQALYSIIHQQFGVLALPLIAGAYFLPFQGNAGVALATAVDTPAMEGVGANGALRLLTGALVYARADGTDGAAAQTIEVLVNGVLVPGMVAGPGFLMTLATNPLVLVPTTPILLQPFDLVSVRVTYGGAGITATPGDLFALLEAA
jgi:hypothetical protein